MPESKFAVIGLGLFGTAIARTLSERGAQVLAMDIDEDKVSNIKDDVAYAVTLDSTDIKALDSQNIRDMDAVVVAIGKDYEALLLTTVRLIDMKVKRIISRAKGNYQRTILEKLGVTEILSPEDEVGRVVAERLLNPNVISFLQLPDNYEIVELSAPKGVVNRSLEDIGLRNKYRLNLVTLKREYEVKKNGETVKEQHILGVPKSDTIIYDTDTIVVFGTIKDIERFIEINH